MATELAPLDRVGWTRLPPLFDLDSYQGTASVVPISNTIDWALAPEAASFHDNPAIRN